MKVLLTVSKERLTSMPELPEVETIKKGLNEYVKGHKILRIHILNPGIFEGEIEKATGARILETERVGKGLIIQLDNGYSLAIHIKLTGQLVYSGKKTEGIEVSKEKVGSVPNRFTHVIFELDGDAKLYYNDQRRFGWIRVVKSREVMHTPFFKSVGPEPFDDLTFEVFQKVIANKSTKIKPLLMDQSRIGGIGNIYANDALFLAKINPHRAAKSLTEEEQKRLYDSIISVMEKGFKYGGASELSFVNVLGQMGEYQRHSLVYGKRKGKCPECGGELKFEKIGGRGTFYCPSCQK